VRRCGFRENPRKTRIQWASRGRREIVGIMVDDAVHVSRDFRRRLRAAKHNAAKNEGDNRLSRQAMGMAEFAKLTPPCDAAEKARRNDGDRKHREAQQIAREYHVGAPDRILREIPDADLGNGVKITTDPVYFYGMSVLTTGWTSCMSLTRSQHTYKKGVAFWQRLKGASLAYLESDNISSIAGITRPAMAERALVFALRDGRRCYGHIYSGRGHSWDHGSVLATALRSAGYVPARECAGALVVGNVAQHCKLPYFDHAAPETVTLDTSKKKAYRVRMR
jgi:hypothetical protein